MASRGDVNTSVFVLILFTSKCLMNLVNKLLRTQLNSHGWSGSIGKSHFRLSQAELLLQQLTVHVFMKPSCRAMLSCQRDAVLTHAGCSHAQCLHTHPSAGERLTARLTLCNYTVFMACAKLCLQCTSPRGFGKVHLWTFTMS